MLNIYPNKMIEKKRQYSKRKLLPDSNYYLDQDK